MTKKPQQAQGHRQGAARPSPPRQRDRARSEAALLDALGKVLREQGISGLTPSNVARVAEVDKSLLYRFFGDFDGLLKAYAQSRTYWPTLEEVVPDPELLMSTPLEERIGIVLGSYANALRRRPETLALLAAELVDPHAVPRVFLERRERFGLAILDYGRDAPPGLDLAALATLLTGSIHYLLVRAPHVDTFNGIDLSSDPGWARLLSTLRGLVRGAVSAARVSRTRRAGRSP